MICNMMLFLPEQICILHYLFNQSQKTTDCAGTSLNPTIFIIETFSHYLFFLRVFNIIDTLDPRAP